MSTSDFRAACNEYRYLRERGYPEKAALKLVADRHRLGRVERNSIFRGIVAASLAQARRSRIVGADALAGAALGIDWYNVLITLESYLGGHPVFLCDDGMIRDSAAVHGSYRASALTPRAVSDIAAVVKMAGPSRVDAYVDAPIAWSARMAEDARAALAAASARTDVVLVHSADYPLKKYDGIVASSDSTIMDCAGRIVDLAGLVLRTEFGFTPLPVEQLFP
jgi:hypothetical protein